MSPTMDDAARILEVDLVGTAVLLDGMVGAAGAGSLAICVASIAAHVLPVSPEAQAVLDDPMAPDLAARSNVRSAPSSDPGRRTRWPSTAWCGCASARHGVGRTRRPGAVRFPWPRRHPHGPAELKDNPGKRGLIGRTPIHAPVDQGSAELPGRTADIADAIAFLAGPQARFISGCDVRVDGGLVAALTAN